MSTLRVNTALGIQDDEIYVFTDRLGSRSLLKNERTDEENCFIHFINAQNLLELMTSLDELVEHFGRLNFIDDLAGFEKPNPVGSELAGRIARMFDENPTRTTLLLTKQAIEIWSIDRVSPNEQMSEWMKNGDPQMFVCTPLRDIIKAMFNLRRVCLMLAWLKDKTTFEMAHGQESGNKEGQVELLNLEDETLLSGYYQKLSKNSGNEFTTMDVPSAVHKMHLYSSEEIRATVAQYTRGAFSLLMSDETRKMSFQLEPYTSNNTILSAIWSYFATGLCSNKPGSISVCAHCGKFFTTKRQTKRYCSDSCRVLHQRSGE